MISSKINVFWVNSELMEAHQLSFLIANKVIGSAFRGLGDLKRSVKKGDDP